MEMQAFFLYRMLFHKSCIYVKINIEMNQAVQFMNTVAR